MAHVVASGSGSRTAAKWLSLGAVLAATIGVGLWVARDADPQPKRSAASVLPAAAPRLDTPAPPITTLERAGSPRVESAAVVTAAFTATPSPAAAPARPALSFTSEAEELSFWQARVPGESLTLEGLETSERALTRVLEAEGSTKPEQRASLEQRREALRAKLALQRTRIEQMQSRIAELERVGGSK